MEIHSRAAQYQAVDCDPHGPKPALQCLNQVPVLPRALRRPVALCRCSAFQL